MKVLHRWSIFSHEILTRRNSLKTRRVYEFGPFRLQADPPLLWREDAIVPLPPKALNVLVVLVRQAGELVEKRTLIDQVWRDTFVEEGNLTQSISLLRKARGESEGQQ